MERELWPHLYQSIHSVGRGFHQKSVQYQPWVIVMVLIWAALHDRPMSWACQSKNWSTTKLRPLQLPSDSTVSKRAKSAGVAMFLHALEVTLRDTQHPQLVALLDAKPLPVGGATKDRTATYGYAAGVMAKGYKLHAIWARRCIPEAWEVMPLNVSEVTMAKELVTRLHDGGYLVGDANYDGNELADIAGAHGYQLLAPPGSPNAGMGHHYQSPYRLRGIQLLYDRFGQDLSAYRRQIERDFGNSVAFAGGLSPLPAWVRTISRVRNWVWAKLLINATRILKLKGLTSSLGNVVETVGYCHASLAGRNLPLIDDASHGAVAASRLLFPHR
jgi:hypothetical protein